MPNFRVMWFCTASVLQSDKMRIQILIRQQNWNGYWRRNTCYLSFNKKNEERERKKESLKKCQLGECSKKEKEKVLLYFFMISGSALSSWILNLLFFLKIVLNKNAVVNAKYVSIKEDQKRSSVFWNSCARTINIISLYLSLCLIALKWSENI